MDKVTRDHFAHLSSDDADSRHASFRHVMEVTQAKVDWASEVWDGLLGLLKEGDNHQRAIAAQVLANLAKSDAEGRMLKDLDRLIAATKDEKFVTARHSLQCLWRVATAGSQSSEENSSRRTTGRGAEWRAEGVAGCHCPGSPGSASSRGTPLEGRVDRWEAQDPSRRCAT